MTWHIFIVENGLIAQSDTPLCYGEGKESLEAMEKILTAVKVVYKVEKQE